MKFTIEQADNGYVVFYHDFISDVDGKDIEVTKSHVIEEKDSEFGEQEAFVSLCWDLMDFFGVNNSKHNRRRINVELTGEEQES
jgi:hypothetical protein